MTDDHDLDRARLAGVLTMAERLPPDVVAEVALAYDLLCDPTDPPAPAMQVRVTDPVSSLRQVRDGLTAAIGTAPVHDALSLGGAARHLRAALDALDRPPAAR